MRVGLVQNGIAIPVLFGLLCHHSCAIPRCRFSRLRGKYVHHGQDAQASDALHQTGVLSQWPRAVNEKWMSIINVSKDTPSPEEHSFSVWQYTGALHSLTRVKLDTQLNSLPRIDQVKKKTAQRLWVLGSFLNSRSLAV